MEKVVVTRRKFLISFFLFLFSKPWLVVLGASTSVIAYLNKWATMRENIISIKIMRDLEARCAGSRDIFVFSLFLLSNLFIKSIAYVLKPSYFLFTEYAIDLKFFREILNLSYDYIDECGVPKLISRHERSRKLFLSSIDSILFTLPVEITSLCVSLGKYNKILEPEYFRLYVFAIIGFALVFFAVKYSALSLEVGIEKLELERTSELTEIHNNFIALRLAAADHTSDDKSFLQQSSNSMFIKHTCISTCSIVIYHSFYTLITIYILNNSKSIKQEISSFFTHGIALGFAIKNIIEALVLVERNWRKMQGYFNIETDQDEIDPLSEYISRFKEHPRLKGITLENVTVKRNDKVILRDISLEFDGHGMIALIGRNGNGKSTFARFLLGLHSYEGSVTTEWVDPSCEMWEYSHDKEPENNENISNNWNDSRMKRKKTTKIKLGKRMFQKAAGYSQQEPNFFESTVIECIMEGSECSREEAIAKMEYYGLHKHFCAMRCGYDTPVEVNMSTQDRHLISLGRALLKDAAVVVLDETLKNLNQEQFTDVLVALRREKENRLIFVIVHKMMEMDVFDSIVKVENGKVTMCELGDVEI